MNFRKILLLLFILAIFILSGCTGNNTNKDQLSEDNNEKITEENETKEERQDNKLLEINFNKNKKYPDLVKADIKENYKYFAKVEKNDMWGIVDDKNEIVLPFKYPYDDSIVYFSKNYFIVKPDGKGYGIINRKGDVIIPFEYSYISPFFGEVAFASGSIYDNEIYKIYKNGKITKLNFDAPFFSNIRKIKTRDNLLNLVMNEGTAVEETILINKEGKLLSHLNYIVPFNEHFIGYTFDEYDMVTGEPIYYPNLLDQNYDIIKSLKGMNIYSFSEGLAKARKNDKYGYINDKGETIIPFEYDSASNFHDGLAPVARNDKFGYINDKGETIIPFEYDSASNFHDGLAPVARNDKFGYINDKGETIIPFEYDSASNFHDGLASVEKNDKAGFINAKGETIIPLEYDSVSNFDDEGLAKAKKNGKEGFINNKGETIIPLEYDNTGEIKK